MQKFSISCHSNPIKIEQFELILYTQEQKLAQDSTIYFYSLNTNIVEEEFCDHFTETKVTVL